MIVTASWPETGITLPTEQNPQYGFEEVNNPLPNDGFPRITSEGMAILIEGLQGNFARWRWKIGNHPLVMPIEHLRNVSIECEKDVPHYMVKVWYGLHYPVTTKNRILTPRWPFDSLDTDRVEKYCNEPRTHITLRQSDDYWAHLSILLDDYGKCAT